MRTRVWGLVKNLITMGEKHSKPKPQVDCGNFPFLKDDNTVQLIKETHTFFILRGLPGSGKSTIGRKISETYQASIACAFADPLGISPMVEEAESSDSWYAKVDEKIQEGLKEVKKVIVVDDNHHNAKRLAYLVDLARDNDYIVLIVTPQTEWKNNCEILAKKNQWKLSVKQLDTIKQGFQEQIVPYYFGWFLMRKSAKEMREKAEDFLNLLSNNDEFLEEFRTNVQWHSEEEFNLQEYFQKRPSVLHCTTKFCDYGTVPNCASYASSKAVAENYGKAFTLNVTALFVTPRTVGARVLLDTDQKLLWPRKEQCEDGSDSEEKTDLPFGSRSHITLACAPGVISLQTGLDLLEILKLVEAGNKPEHQLETAEGLLCCYGEGRWIVDLTKPVEVKTLFSGFYPKKKPTTESEEN
ncbi:2',3'-cyclic-nucleotide 3'-phosphodiesterase isoform X1 [Cetorhinus maximus]